MSLADVYVCIYDAWKIFTTQTRTQIGAAHPTTSTATVAKHTNTHLRERPQTKKGRRFDSRKKTIAVTTHTYPSSFYTRP